MANMQGKTVLITGASQGIGKASAVALGKRGAKLFLVCRSEDRARTVVAELQRAGIEPPAILFADLSSQADVRRLASEFKSKSDRLDVLLNNAGALVPSRRTSVDGIEQTFALNHLGYFLLTHLLIDTLTAGAPSRIVNVSSEAHRRARMRWDDLEFKTGGYRGFTAYGQSKLANILFTRELARRLEGTGVTANCLHPGVVASGFGQTYGGVMSILIRMAHPFMITPAQGAATSVYLASSQEVAGVSGKYFDKCQQRQPSDAALEAEAPERLWAISEELTGVRAKSSAAA
jgi:NAD(P)-dependent dehydrogenase (short-subunit alcohol dehydrogenase family)